MDNLCRFADRPIAFFVHYVRMRPISHALITVAVLAAVSCSVSTQYGVKFLVDTLSVASEMDAAGGNAAGREAPSDPGIKRQTFTPAPTARKSAARSRSLPR